MANDTTPTKTDTKAGIVPDVAFGVALVRGIAAIAAGLLLIFYPDKTRAMLGNMMGIFWLLSGIALLRRSKDDSLVKMVGGRTSKIIAVVGILTGLLVITRSFSRQVLPEGTLIVLLGVVIMLTGVMHALAEIRVGGAAGSRHRILHLILGIFEIVFGITLIWSPLDRSPASYWIATIWALIFGALVIGDAVAEFMKRHKEKDKGGDDDDSDKDSKPGKTSATKNPADDNNPVDEADGSQSPALETTAPDANSNPVSTVERT